MRTRVVHVAVENHEVYIGRGTPWGNPYIIGRDGTREQCIAQHKKDLLRNPSMLTRIQQELKGKVLGCHCKPKACHGDTYVEIADAQQDTAGGLLRWALP